MPSRPISAAYLERKLRAILSVQGDNPLPGLSDVNGLLVLENDRPEWAKAGGEVLAAGSQSIGAVAAQIIAFELRNPTNSGVLGIIEAINASIGAPGPGIFRVWEAFSVSDLPTTQNSARVARDLRALAGVGDSVALQFSSEQSAAPAVGGRVSSHRRAIADTPTSCIDGPIILPPGTAIFVDESVINVSMACTITWRERPLEGTWELK